MLPVLTAENVREIDAACEARGISTETLMGNAGYAVAAAAQRMLGGSYGKRVVVACGKGNNAGDGLVAGRVLSSWGASVSAVLTLGDEIKGAAKTALERFPGRRVAPEELEREFGRADLVIDAIFGVGLTRPPEGPVMSTIDRINLSGVAILSIDVPSGIDSDTGQISRNAAAAKVTVTLHALKAGLLFEPGRSHAGRVEIADIGVPDDIGALSYVAMDRQDVRESLSYRSAQSDKRNVGTVLLVVGSRAMPGAAALAAGASVRSGAGLTIVAAPESIVPTIVARVPEVTTIPMPETGDGTIDPKGVELITPRLKEFHAAALGPGLSAHAATAELVRSLVADLSVPTILDADAITAMIDAEEILENRKAMTSITPHAGELARAMGTTVQEIGRDRIAAARSAAKRWHCTVLLKGPGTVIASPDLGFEYVTTTGGRSLAQGGTGDVLTGLLASLMAQATQSSVLLPGLHEAAAAWIHGRAGDRIAERVAPHPASPTMLIEELPAVLHEVAG